jgi:scyllo-inositol 2-dehydrogenase (NADP+)
MTTSNDIHVALIGFGLAGRCFHAPVISRVSGLRLAAILQRSGNEAAQLYPTARIVRALDELLSIDEIRLIVIATPNDTHFPLAKQCLAAGRDVVVDKPFTTTLDEAIALVQFAQQAGRLLTVYQNRRFDGDFQAVQQVVAGGELGRIVRFESNYDRFRPQLKPAAWREKAVPGAGILFDLAPHLIDAALVLFGLPEAITADIRCERDHAVVDDAFDLMLHYPRELRALLRASMLAATTRPRFRLHGTHGTYEKQAFDVQEPKLRAGRIPWEETPTEAEARDNEGVLTLLQPDGTTQARRIPPGNTDYRDFYANVRDAILGRANLAVSPEYALNVMQVLELARESSARRCTLPWQSPSIHNRAG